MNTLFLIGRVGKTPEIKTFSNGKQATFSVATTTFWRNKEGERQERTEWHNVVVNGKLAEVVEMFVEKGDKIAVVGEIRHEEWTDSIGAKRGTTKVYAEKIELLGEVKKRNEGTIEPKQVVIDNSGEETEDLPF